jgi:hypothetical protein
VNRQPKYEHLEGYKYKPGQSGNLKGRPKNYITVLRELGYSKPMLAVMVAEIAFMPYYKVRELANSDTEPSIRVTIARAFQRAAHSGEYKFIADYLVLLLGRPVPFIPLAPPENNLSPKVNPINS